VSELGTGASGVAERLKQRLRTQAPSLHAKARFLRRPAWWWGYLKGCWYTLRYVDSHTTFPAIRFEEPVRLRIVKSRHGRIEIAGQLVVSSWMGGAGATRLFVDRGGRLVIYNDVRIGHDVLLVVSQDALLQLGGRDRSESSGITCNAIVFATQSITIGRDCIVSWNTTITDSDHHPVDGVVARQPVVLGDRVWVSMGARILKGAEVGADSVVGASALVLRGAYPDRSVLGGVPAKVIRTDCPPWSSE